MILSSRKKNITNFCNLIRGNFKYEIFFRKNIQNLSKFWQIVNNIFLRYIFFLNFRLFCILISNTSATSTVFSKLKFMDSSPSRQMRHPGWCRTSKNYLPTPHVRYLRYFAFKMQNNADMCKLNQTRKNSPFFCASFL